MAEIDYGLWFVDQEGSNSRGTLAIAEVTTPTAYTCQASTYRTLGGSSKHVPAIVWYAFIGMADTYLKPTRANFESGVYLDTDGKIYLFQLGTCLEGQNESGWDTRLISSIPLYGEKIRITIDVSSATTFYATAKWTGGSVTLASGWKGNGYNQGCVFKKEMTLGTNFQSCLTNLWTSPYTANERNAKVTNFKMGPVSVYDRNGDFLETINGTRNYHVSKETKNICGLPGNPSVTTSNGVNTLSFNLAV